MINYLVEITFRCSLHTILCAVARLDRGAKETAAEMAQRVWGHSYFAAYVYSSGVAEMTECLFVFLP